MALAGRGDRIAVRYGSDRVVAEETVGLLAGAGHTVVGGDLSEPEAAETIVEAAAQVLGGIDVPVKDAAIAPSERHRHPVETSTTGSGSGGRCSERQAEKLASPTGDSVRAQRPFGRGTPEEVAHAVLYLTSPEAAWASGAILDLNGAFHLRA